MQLKYMSFTKRLHTGYTYALNNAITITMLLTLLYLLLWPLIYLRSNVAINPRSQQNPARRVCLTNHIHAVREAHQHGIGLLGGIAFCRSFFGVKLQLFFNELTRLKVEMRVERPVRWIPPPPELDFYSHAWIAFPFFNNIVVFFNKVFKRSPSIRAIEECPFVDICDQELIDMNDFDLFFDPNII